VHADLLDPIVTILTAVIGYGALRAELVRIRLIVEKHERKHEVLEQRLQALERNAA
jgi:hypothetical protein